VGAGVRLWDALVAQARRDAFLLWRYERGLVGDFGLTDARGRPVRDPDITRAPAVVEASARHAPGGVRRGREC